MEEMKRMGGGEGVNIAMRGGYNHNKKPPL